MTLWIANTLGFYVVAAVLMCGLYRLWRGPHAADRVVAFDLISAAMLVLLLLISLTQKQKWLIDVFTGLAILSFVSTVGFAYYLDQRGKAK